MGIKLYGPKGNGGLSHGEQSFQATASGAITIPDDAPTELIQAAYSHGFSTEKPSKKDNEAAEGSAADE